MGDSGRGMLALIEKSKRQQQLTAQEFGWLIGAYVAGDVPDYQMAAWLMAVCLKGMTTEEAVAFTQALVDSGRRLDLRGRGLLSADKHSTGGIGDKTTLVLAPLVAAAGLPVAKMSGRGLGFTGGTLDKLEAIPGLRVDLSTAAFVQQAETVGLVIAGQTEDLAPGDGKLYALRDVTGTVDSIPLIAASVMSKKLAAGASYLVLDVKMGGGAFMEQPTAAADLADTMLAIARQAGLPTVAALTWMDQPLGRAIGNALEVEEALQTLRGGGPADLRDLCLTLGVELLLLAGVERTEEGARQRLDVALTSGAGLQKLRAMVAAQGGDPRVIDQPGRLPAAPARLVITAEAAGFVQTIAARELGYAAISLGAGRLRKGDEVDHATGFVLRAKVGDRVARGDELATIHARTTEAAAGAAAAVRAAYVVGEAAPQGRPLVAGMRR